MSFAKHICLLLISLCLLLQPASALLPRPAHPKPAPAERVFRQIAGRLSALLQLPRSGHRLGGLNPDDRYNITTPGTFSLVCALMALTCMGAFALTGFSLLMIPVFCFAVLAAVFGAVGMIRHKRGYAIAGFTLGLLEIVAGFMILALVL